MNTETAALTDNQKMQIIHALPTKFEKDWNALSKDAKREVLKGMDIGTDVPWVTSLIEEAKENK